MNKKWAELNKTLQDQLKKEETFTDGVQTVFRLRQELFDVLCQLKSELTREEFKATTVKPLHTQYGTFFVLKILLHIHLSGMMKNYLCWAISLTVSIVLS